MKCVICEQELYQNQSHKRISISILGFTTDAAVCEDCSKLIMKLRGRRK